MDGLKPTTIFNGRYRVERALKSGGMGHVYEVLDLHSQRSRALKTMSRTLALDEASCARFALEARIAAPVRSDHIVDVFDAGVDQETALPFLVMDLLEGQDLESLVQAQGPLSATETVELLWQASLALDKAHDIGIVHRDLKPANLFRTLRDTGEPCLKILDFGIAKMVESVGAQTTQVVGTAIYMAPEQFAGSRDIDRRTDVYALALVAFTLLTGRAYWQPEFDTGGAFAVMAALVRGGIQPARKRAALNGVELPAHFDGWFERGTATDMSRRFDTAGELVLDLCRTFGLPRPRAVGASVPPSRARSAVSDLELAPTVQQSRARPASRPDADTLAAVAQPPPARGSRLRWVGVGVLALAALVASATQRPRTRGEAGASTQDSARPAPLPVPEPSSSPAPPPASASAAAPSTSSVAAPLVTARRATSPPVVPRPKASATAPEKRRDPAEDYDDP